MPISNSSGLTELARAQSYSFRELAIWRLRLPEVSHAVLPPLNTRPNPLVHGNRLFVSIFSRGAICCIEREIGRLIWRRPVTRFGQASVCASGKSLLANTEHSIYSLRPDSGEVLWSFCPYGTAGEWIYSSPTLYKKKVYVGDRKGFLHCIDSETGKTIWRRCTSRARNNAVNSTPVVSQGLVIVSTNARMAVAYEAESGRLA